jgi:hypothetical protein
MKREDYMNVHWFVILLSLVGSLLLPIGSARAENPDVAGEDGASTMLGHRKLVELSIAPDKIARVMIDTFDSDEAQIKINELTEFLGTLRYKGAPFKEPLPLESQHTEAEMVELRKDALKWQVTYDREIRAVLKDQYYVWKELHQIAEALENRRVEEPYHDYYDLRISLKDGVSGIEQVTYSTTNYLDAKTIAEDLRKGVIKSLTVYTGHFQRQRETQKEGKWVPCAPACRISAFGY